MSPDLWFLLVLAIKMAVAAAFVVTASFIAERAGALVGAMVMTLPVGAGPAYVLRARSRRGVHRRVDRREPRDPRRVGYFSVWSMCWRRSAAPSGSPWR
jgi:hypothetical protein